MYELPWDRAESFFGDIEIDDGIKNQWYQNSIIIYTNNFDILKTLLK